MPAAPAPAPVAGAPAPAATPEQPAITTAHVLVVDAAGNPMAGMAPIVTRQANAFDQPVASGVLTGTDGTGTVRAPANEHLYLRAWDPKLRFFAMNYYDLLPSEGGDTEEMTIQMREAGSFRMKAVDATGQPLAQTPLRAMLVHEKAGAWWPVESTTDSTGVAIFQPAPPGKFLIQLGRPDDTTPVELPALLLPPGELADAGTVTLGN
jgi:hypothetical protein